MENNNKKLLLILTIGLASVYFILKPKQVSAQQRVPIPNPPNTGGGTTGGTSGGTTGGGSVQQPPLISSLQISPNASNITSTSVKLFWKINQSTGAFLYPKYEYTITILNTNKQYKVTAQNSDGGFIDISGLTPNTQYSFEIYATDVEKNISPKVIVKLTTPAISGGTTSGCPSGYIRDTNGNCIGGTTGGSTTGGSTTGGSTSGGSTTGGSTTGGGSTSGSGGSTTGGSGPIGGDFDPNNLGSPTGGKTGVIQTISIMASQPTENSVNISWSASSPTAVKSFDVYQGNTLKTSILPSLTNANMIPISGLLPSTQYTFYVIANNNNGTTSSSGQISITTQAAVSSGGGFVNDTETTTSTGTTGSYGGGGGGTISTNYDYDNMYKDPTSQFDNPINRDIEVLY